MTAVRRIGLFGGSFDPVHNAHVAFARVALDHLALDEVLWVPAGHPWQKLRQLADAPHREAMVRLAIDGELRYALERIELDRSGPTYTLDTVRALQQREPGAQWFLMIGQDQYTKLDTWLGWRELLERVTLAVAGREGASPQPSAALARVPHAMQALPLPAMAVSATAIRARIEHGQPIDDLVPPAVARYIARHGLYRAAASPPARS